MNKIFRLSCLSKPFYVCHNKSVPRFCSATDRGVNYRAICKQHKLFLGGSVKLIAIRKLHKLVNRIRSSLIADTNESIIIKRTKQGFKGQHGKITKIKLNIAVQQRTWAYFIIIPST